MVLSASPLVSTVATALRRPASPAEGSTVITAGTSRDSSDCNRRRGIFMNALFGHGIGDDSFAIRYARKEPVVTRKKRFDGFFYSRSRNPTLDVTSCPPEDDGRQGVRPAE